MDKTCKTCRHADLDTLPRTCHLMPPMCRDTYSDSPDDAYGRIIILHPLIDPDSWCGQWSQRRRGSNGKGSRRRKIVCKKKRPAP